MPLDGATAFCSLFAVEQIGLLDEVEDLVLLPVLVAEAAVVGAGVTTGSTVRPIARSALRCTSVM